ncbi:MAG: glycosyltransferase family 2 protein [Phycisphaerae bacterium]|nr:glycosyltransferase family 2 protein [Phycisphaerae bacterium]
MLSLFRAIVFPTRAPSLAERRGAIGSTPRAEGGTRLQDPSLPASDPQRPLVSVVTVCFRSAKTIAETIAGVRAQAYRPIEYIVIDGGSDDGTLDILRGNEDIISYWRSEPDGGIYDAFNKGIALARGEFVQIINSDDWMTPDQIERAVATALRERVDLVHGDIWMHGWRGHDVRIGGDPHWAQRVARTMPTIHQATVLCRRSVYERVGLFRTDLRIASDYDWFIRVAEASITSIHDPKVIAHMRAGGASTTRQRRTIAEGFACAYGNGDSLVPCARHWGGRLLWPNGRSRSWKSLAQAARARLKRAALRAANRVPLLRRTPGRAFIKRVLGMPTTASAIALAPAGVPLADFLAVRDLGHGLPDLTIEQLLRDAKLLSPVALADQSPMAVQAAEALRRGGAEVVTIENLQAVPTRSFRTAVVADLPESVQRWRNTPTVVALGSDRCRVAEHRGQR